MNDAKVEKALQKKGLNAPRLNPDLINAAIAAEQYYVFPGTTLTVCCLTLQNGFNIVGESAAASPENFDAGIGRQVARAHAHQQIWKLEGYLLKQRLHDTSNTPPAPHADLPPHQQRVIGEQVSLQDKIEKLEGFVMSEMYDGLAVTEQDRLQAQLAAMRIYLSILNERVREFGVA